MDVKEDVPQLLNSKLLLGIRCLDLLFRLLHVPRSVIIINADFAFGEPLGLLENNEYFPWLGVIFDSVWVLPPRPDDRVLISG